MVTCVGNHDVGFNALAEISYEIDESSPNYFRLLPQEFGDTKGIPEFNERKSYQYHDVGNIRLFSLDSGYLHSYDDSNYILLIVEYFGQF